MGYDQVLIRVNANKDKVGEAVAKVVARRYVDGDICEEAKGFFGGKKLYIDERFTLDEGDGYTAITIRRYDSDGYRNIREEYIERIYDVLKPMGIVRTVGLGIEKDEGHSQ